VYGGLLYRDSKGELQPYYATSVTSPDATVWTVKIRPGIKFTDGTPYDASAVKVNWLRVIDPAVRSPQFGAASVISTIDVVDSQTLRATLKAPTASFRDLLEGDLGWIASPAALQRYGADYGTTEESTVGAGPFKVSKWVHGSYVQYERNAAYWDAPRPYLKTVTINTVADFNTQYNSLTTGALDFMAATGTQFEQGSSAAGITAVRNLTGLTAFRIILNMRRAPFNDPNVRKAMTLAIDPKQVNTIRYQGEGLMLDSLYGPKSTWYTPSAKFPKHDAKKADALFDQASKQTGSPVTITYLVADLRANLGEGDEMIAEMAGYDNVKINVKVVASSAYVSTLQSGDWDMAFWPMSTPDPTNAVRAWTTGESLNYAGYSNPVVDAAAKAANATGDVPTRQEAYTSLFKQVLVDVPAFFLPVADPRVGWLHSDRLRGLTVTTTGPLLAELWTAAGK
jgi:peptide/nickel transport system substrate-binding protein